MDLLELDEYERKYLIDCLLAHSQREGLSVSERSVIDGLLSKFKQQNPATLARLEVFALLECARFDPVRLGSVLRRLWEMIG